MKRENTGRSRAVIYAAVLTALLLCLLFFFYQKYEKSRTLHKALQNLSGDPLIFSEESGFFEEGFTLLLGRDPELPKDVEIRYTLNGDEPTADSLLYSREGIDLAAAVKQMQEDAAAKEVKKAEVIRQADEEAEAARIAAEQAAAAATAATAAEASETGADDNASANNTEGTSADDTKDASVNNTEGTSADDAKDASASDAKDTSATDAKDASASDAKRTLTSDEKDAAADEAGDKEAVGGTPEKGEAAEEARPTLEEGREAWESEKWTAAADSGLRPERADDGICVLPVRACLVQGEDRSPVVTRTYVIGPNVNERYDVYVASVVTDSYNLFDYDNGIMIPGSHYESDVADGVRADRAGNFYQQGDEWIKSGHVTLFTSDGDVLLEEETGIAIAGYSSRILPTRTLRMEAEKIYGTSDDYFHLDIFSDPGSASKTDAEDASGTDAEGASGAAPGVITARLNDSVNPDFDLYKKIKFRTHGIPEFHIRSVRNQYAKEITDECGFPGLTENRLGVVFLNGEFYTVCDITPSTTADYVCRLFGLNVPDGIEKYSGSDVDVYTRTKIIKLFTADLTQEVNQRALEEKVDMDNYLFYFALEVLFNNADWPYNNVTVWRYLGDEASDNPYTDGRIRFLVEDMDQILTNGLHGDPARWSTELIDYLMKDKGNTFCHVMQCTRYRDTFLTYVDDLLKTAFEPEHACAILDRLYAELKTEYVLSYGEAFWTEMEETAEVTKQNVREKEALYRENITKYMDLTDRYEVRIETGDGASVTWNNMTVSPGGIWENEYYRGTAFTVTACPADGFRIDGWEVNGKKVEGEGADGSSLIISDALSESGSVRVTVRTEREP